MLEIESAAKLALNKGLFTASEAERYIDNLILTNAVENIRFTPRLAQYTLNAYNNRNRAISKAKTQQYAKAMKEGRWKYTGETISFSHDRLLNGAHRLTACVMSGVPLYVLCVFGIDDDAFDVMDRRSHKLRKKPRGKQDE